MSLRRLLPASVVTLFLAAACASGGDPGTDDGEDGGSPSTASDAAGHDSTAPGADAAMTPDTGAGTDSSPGADSSPGDDATSGGDTGTGAETSGADTGTPEAGIDGGAEASADTGAPEASVDTGTDSPVGNPNCPNTCAGCCDVNNVCYTTHTDTECPENNSPGTTGQPCVDCTAMGPAFHCILDIIVYACFP